MRRLRDLPDWHTGPFAREGLALFVHLIRSPDDPDESRPRGSGHDPHAWRRRLGDTPVAAWRGLILELLADGVPRTFNRISVELCGYTADVAFQKNPDAALWELVRDELLEHSLVAPVVFRRRDRRG